MAGSCRLGQSHTGLYTQQSQWTLIEMCSWLLHCWVSLHLPFHLLGGRWLCLYMKNKRHSLHWHMTCKLKEVSVAKKCMFPDARECDYFSCKLHLWFACVLCSWTVVTQFHAPLLTLAMLHIMFSCPIYTAKTHDAIWKLMGKSNLAQASSV